VPDNTVAPTWFTASNTAVQLSLQAILSWIDKQDERLYLLERPPTLKSKRPALTPRGSARPTPTCPDDLPALLTRIDDVDIAAGWHNDPMDATEDVPSTSWADDPMDPDGMYGEEALHVQFNLPDDFDPNLDTLLDEAQKFLQQAPQPSTPDFDITDDKQFPTLRASSLPQRTPVTFLSQFNKPGVAKAYNTKMAFSKVASQTCNRRNPRPSPTS